MMNCFLFLDKYHMTFKFVRTETRIVRKVLTAHGFKEVSTFTLLLYCLSLHLFENGIILSGLEIVFILSLIRDSWLGCHITIADKHQDIS